MMWTRVVNRAYDFLSMMESFSLVFQWTIAYALLLFPVNIFFRQWIMCSLVDIGQYPLQNCSEFRVPDLSDYFCSFAVFVLHIFSRMFSVLLKVMLHCLCGGRHTLLSFTRIRNIMITLPLQYLILWTAL